MAPNQIYNDRGYELYSYPVRKFAPGYMLSCLSLAISLWIIVWALGQANWPRCSKNQIEMASMSVFPAYTLALILAAVECSEYSSLSASAMFSAGILSCAGATAFCIVTPGWRNLFERAFFIMGGIFVGFAFEAITGFFKFCINRLMRYDLSATQARKTT